MKLYNWQNECISNINNNNAVISAPTSSGKTLVSYIWAGLLDYNLNPVQKLKSRVIFTAPIKALSNERYKDLTQLGFNVGLETGDFKRNIYAPILCCTQEIYTAKYAIFSNQKVIIDEFHYITTNLERSRAYIDGLIKTSLNSKLLVMSATFGSGIERLKNYLENITGRSFMTYETDFRPTKLVYMDNSMSIQDIAENNCLVFVFSYKGIIGMADEIAYYRQPLDSDKMRKLNRLVEKYKINIDKFPTLKYGVGVYYGKMFPKEKFFMEHLFRNNIIDILVGTDALSLGINTPAQYVVFAQLAKYYDGPISKNEFIQMSGRAGRKGFHDTGYVSWNNSSYEAYGFETDELYHDLVKKLQEPFEFILGVNSEQIVSKLTLDQDHDNELIEKEVEYILKYSLPPENISLEKLKEETKEKLEYFIENIYETINYISEEYNIDKKEILKILKRLYFNEFTIVDNLRLLKLIITAKINNSVITLNNLIGGIDDEQELFYHLLKIRKFYKRLHKSISHLFEKGFMEQVEGLILNIDHISISTNI